MNHRRPYRALALLAACASLALGAAAVHADPSNKWRIKVNEGANNDGQIVLRVTPVGGTAQEITINIGKGRSENGVARDIEQVLRKQLDGKMFKVETDDGEDVLVKKKGKAPDFDLEVVSSTLEGTHLKLHRE